MLSEAVPARLEISLLNFGELFPVCGEERLNQRQRGWARNVVAMTIGNDLKLVLGLRNVTKNPMLQHPAPGGRMQFPIISGNSLSAFGINAKFRKLQKLSSS
jgi:hypothetical protein